jgi:hypothetical protein
LLFKFLIPFTTSTTSSQKCPEEAGVVGKAMQCLYNFCYRYVLLFLITTFKYAFLSEYLYF